MSGVCDGACNGGGASGGGGVGRAGGGCWSRAASTDSGEVAVIEVVGIRGGYVYVYRWVVDVECDRIEGQRKEMELSIGDVVVGDEELELAVQEVVGVAGGERSG